MTVGTTGNRLLANLQASALRSLLGKSTRVVLSARQVLQRAEAEIEAAYFPEEGMLCLVAGLDDGSQPVAAAVGNEGMIGYSLIAGSTIAFSEVVAVMPSVALRIGAADFLAEPAVRDGLMPLLLAFADALQAQVVQNAACNVRHGLDRRFAYWLLMAHDRTGQDDLPLTQEYMSMMLGVHRPSLAVAARALHGAGLIRQSGGRVTIVDRAGFEMAACECYGNVTRYYRRMLRMTEPNVGVR